MTPPLPIGNSRTVPIDELSFTRRSTDNPPREKRLLGRGPYESWPKLAHKGYLCRVGCYTVHCHVKFSQVTEVSNFRSWTPPPVAYVAHVVGVMPSLRTSSGCARAVIAVGSKRRSATAVDLAGEMLHMGQVVTWK